MNKTLPVWLFLLFALLGLMFLVVFGYSVKDTLLGARNTGAFGKAAVTISDFPNTTKTVFQDLWTQTFNHDQPVQVPRPSLDYTGYTRLKGSENFGLDDVIIKADMEAVSRNPGWRIIAGAFSIDGEIKNAALALSPDLTVVNLWLLEEEQLGDLEVREGNRKFVHGFDVFRDGSIVYAFDGGISMRRLDQCGNTVWAKEGLFHHAITLAEDEKYAWGMQTDTGFVKLDAATGETLRKFDIADIVAANPDIDILEIRQFDASMPNGNGRNTMERWLTDPFHLNDIEPLPAALAGYFDDFNTGDLLISLRSLNLIMVIDPESLKIKWWRMGETRRQHDPDWSDGTITVYDNRMSRDFSRIVRLDPKTLEKSIVFDGKSNDWYSRIRGKHQITESGNMLITSAQQGRFFEVDRAGHVLLDILTQKPDSEDRNYSLSQAIWLPENTFNMEEDFTCQK